MRQPDGRESSRFARLREWNRWHSPFWVHYGAYLAVTGSMFLVLLAVGVPAITALLIGAALGTITEYGVDWRWRRSK
jgi:hypothetical protein